MPQEKALTHRQQRPKVVDVAKVVAVAKVVLGAVVLGAGALQHLLQNRQRQQIRPQSPQPHAANCRRALRGLAKLTWCHCH